MEGFEAFKESRERIDPSSRKMTDHQWKQAYQAHLSARGRVSAGGGDNSSVKRRRSSSKSEAVRGQHQPSSLSDLGSLRHRVRQQSAYRDLRILVDVLAWFGVVLVVVAVIISMLYYTVMSAAVVALLGALVKAVAIVFFRALAHAVIDIPDIALYRALEGRGRSLQEDPSVQEHNKKL